MRFLYKLFRFVPFLLWGGGAFLLLLRLSADAFPTLPFWVVVLSSPTSRLSFSVVVFFPSLLPLGGLALSLSHLCGAAFPPSMDCIIDVGRKTKCFGWFVLVLPSCCAELPADLVCL